MKKLYILCCVAMLSTVSLAQLSIGGDPLSFLIENVSSQEFELLEYPPLDLDLDPELLPPPLPFLFLFGDLEFTFLL